MTKYTTQHYYLSQNIDIPGQSNNININDKVIDSWFTSRVGHAL